MKNSMKNSIAKDGRKSKGKFGGFIKSYFLEILGIVFIIILLIALVTGKKTKTYNNIKNIQTPSSVKVNREPIVQKNNSKFTSTLELNEGHENLFIGKYTNNGIFLIKPVDILRELTILRFSNRVYKISINGDPKVLKELNYEIINQKNEKLIDKINMTSNNITIYLNRNSDFILKFDFKDRQNVAQYFIENNTLFSIEFNESLAE
jgi:hypothetical protein